MSTLRTRIFPLQHPSDMILFLNKKILGIRIKFKRLSFLNTNDLKTVNVSTLWKHDVKN